MNDSIEAARQEQASPSVTPASQPSTPTGVRGWLLVLCIMLTIVGPMISVWIVATDFDAQAAHFAGSHEAQWATILDIALTTCSVVFGIYAGIRLWAVRPGALPLAKGSLVFALVVDILTTTISTLVDPTSATGVFDDVLLRLVPSLLFFTLCLGYLNRSARVEATYRPGA